MASSASVLRLPRLGTPASLPRSPRSWIISTAAVAISYLLISHGLMAALGAWQIPLFLGVICGLMAESALQAALVASIVSAGLEAALPPAIAGGGSLGLAGWMASLALVSASAAGIAAARWAVGVDEERQVSLALSVLLVACALANLWAPLFAGPAAFTGYGALSAATIREVPKPGAYVNDDAVYRSIFYSMHSSTPYYASFQRAWEGLRDLPPLPKSVVAYRLPTMYWLWRLLPNDAFDIVPLFLAFATAGCVAAAFITARLSDARLAPLAALALAAYAMAVAATVYVTYIDLPTMSVALVAIALFVGASTREDERLLWAAAAAACVAALTREILAYVIVLALLSAFVGPAATRWRRVAPWFAALVVFAAGYALHVHAVLTLIGPRTGTLGYLKGSPAFAFDSIRRFSDVISLGGALLPLLFALGILGAWAARQRAGLQFSLFAGAALVLPVLAMVKIGNPGIDAAGLQVNYWGNLVVPFALALWPVSANLLPDWRMERPDAVDAATHDETARMRSE